LWTRSQGFGNPFAVGSPAPMLVKVAPRSREVSQLTPICAVGDKNSRKRTSSHICPTTTPSTVAISGLSYTKNTQKFPGQVCKIAGHKKDFISGDREERAAKRQAFFGSFRSHGGVAITSILETHSVLEVTRRDYQERVRKFEEFVAEVRLPVDSVSAIDAALVEYLDMMFLEGFTIEEANKTVAAWVWHHPDHSKKAGHKLLRTYKALQGWTKLAPATTRPPMPLVFLTLIIDALCQNGAPDTALAVLLMFFAYLRPGEATRLCESDIVRPAFKGQPFAINLHPSVKGLASKVNVSDESILLDSPQAPYLGDLFESLKQGKCDASLFRKDYNVMKKDFEIAQKAVGFKQVRYVMYQARHGGPSHDRRLRQRSLQEVQQRGRWMTNASLHRYEAHARLQQEELKESVLLREKGTRLIETIGAQLLVGLKQLQAASGPTLSTKRSSSSMPAQPGCLVPLPPKVLRRRPGTSVTAVRMTS